MSFKGRIAKLEGGSSPCPECGGSSGYPRAPAVFAIHTRDKPYDGPENCPACGRPLSFTFDVEAASGRGGPGGGG